LSVKVNRSPLSQIGITDTQRSLYITKAQYHAKDVLLQRRDSRTDGWTDHPIT